MQLIVRDIILIHLLLFCSCSTPYKSIEQSNGEYDIIKHVLDNEKLSDYAIYDAVNNKLLKEFLDKNVQLDENGRYAEFGTLRQFAPSEILESIFTKGNLDHMYLKLDKRKNERWSQKDKDVQSLLKIRNSNLDIENSNKYYKMSSPIIISQEKYALIGYSSKAGKYDEHGTIAILLYQKKETKWTLISRFPF